MNVRGILVYMLLYIPPDVYGPYIYNYGQEGNQETYHPIHELYQWKHDGKSYLLL